MHAMLSDNQASTPTLCVAEVITLPCFTQIKQVTQIDGGVVNACCRVHAANGTFLVKRLMQVGNKHFDRQQQYQLQTGLSQQGLAPAPVYYCEQRQLWVESWVEHISVCQQEGRSGQLASLAKALATLHQTDLAAPELPLNSDWQGYISALPQSQQYHWQQQLRQIEPLWQQARQHDQVLCHNDLALVHLAAGEDPFIFDWEYAARGSRYFDLASAIAVNRLTLAEEEKLLTCYASVTGLAFLRLQQYVRLYRPILEFTNALWFAAVES